MGARARNAAETKISTLEGTIKTLTVEIEELRTLKIQLEANIEKWRADNADWKKKYENEARLRVEETDALKKKFTVETNNLQDIIAQLEQKLKAAENQKAKLTNEVNVLIKDVEHSQVVIKELTEKLRISDKSNSELGTKLKEMTNLYERADRENKAKAQDLVKMGNDMDRLKMANEVLTRDKGKLEDELKSLKMELDALKKRYARWSGTTGSCRTSARSLPAPTRTPTLPSRRRLTAWPSWRRSWPPCAATLKRDWPAPARSSRPRRRSCS